MGPWGSSGVAEQPERHFSVFSSGFNGTVRPRANGQFTVLSSASLPQISPQRRGQRCSVSSGERLQLVQSIWVSEPRITVAQCLATTALSSFLHMVIVAATLLGL